MMSEEEEGKKIGQYVDLALKHRWLVLGIAIVVVIVSYVV
jgi:uncharacterized protein involved in exopolysaccharide biosynthesis